MSGRLHDKHRADGIIANARFLIGQMILIALLALACIGQHFRWYAAVAFLPVLLRGLAWFAASSEVLAIQAFGKSELVYACMFGVLLVLGMLLP